MDVDKEERVVVDILTRLRDMIKKTTFDTPETEGQVEAVTEELREVTDTYLDFIYDTNALNRMLLNDITTLKEVLKTERARTDALEKKLLQYNISHPAANISRRQFSLYMQAVNERDATDAEWAAFIDTFIYDSVPFTRAVYRWIDSECDM